MGSLSHPAARPAFSYPLCVCFQAVTEGVGTTSSGRTHSMAQSGVLADAAGPKMIVAQGSDPHTVQPDLSGATLAHLADASQRHAAELFGDGYARRSRKQ